MKIALIDKMGDDLTVVNAAKASFAKLEHSFNDKEHTRLIKYLSENKHWTPFAHPQVQFLIEAPIFVRTQWFKHVVGIVRNEVSRRYITDRPKYWMPEDKLFRLKPEGSVKQGSKQDEFIGLEDMPMEKYGSYHNFETICDLAVDYYEFMLDNGACAEQARAVLPQGVYTSWCETASLQACARIAELRTHPHAQKEIRDLAWQLDNIMKEAFPVSWEALTSVNVYTKEN